MELIKWLNQHKFIYWIPVYASVIIILYFSLLPQPFSSIGIPRGDLLNFNTLHIIAYFGVSLVMGIAFRHSNIEILKNHSYIWAIFFGTFLGGFVEFAQDFIPGRYLGFMDLVLNMIGVFSAQLIRFILKRNKQLDALL